MRRAAHLAALTIVVLAAAPADAAPEGHCYLPDGAPDCADGPVADESGTLLPGLHAVFGDPTDRYGHGVLGDAIEWGSLTFIRQGSPGRGAALSASVTLPGNRVFEDLVPRPADLDGDGTPELVVVETEVTRGAQLAVYALVGDRLQKQAATPHIGTANRWLAPAGATDLDGDGRVEIAFVDRPHLARILRIWRYEGGTLSEVAALAGVTNHRIGDAFIAGGLRMCGERREIVVADATWSTALAIGLRGDGRLTRRDLGSIGGAADLDRYLACSR